MVGRYLSPGVAILSLREERTASVRFYVDTIRSGHDRA